MFTLTNHIRSEKKLRILNSAFSRKGGFVILVLLTIKLKRVVSTTDEHFHFFRVEHVRSHGRVEMVRLEEVQGRMKGMALVSFLGDDSHNLYKITPLM
jgi:hypothetical protein